MDSSTLGLGSPLYCLDRLLSSSGMLLPSGENSFPKNFGDSSPRPKLGMPLVPSSKTPERFITSTLMNILRRSVSSNSFPTTFLAEDCIRNLKFGWGENEDDDDGDGDGMGSTRSKSMHQFGTIVAANHYNVGNTKWRRNTTRNTTTTTTNNNNNSNNRPGTSKFHRNRCLAVKASVTSSGISTFIQEVNLDVEPEQFCQVHPKKAPGESLKLTPLDDQRNKKEQEKRCKKCMMHGREKATDQKKTDKEGFLWKIRNKDKEEKAKRKMKNSEKCPFKKEKNECEGQENAEETYYNVQEAVPVYHVCASQDGNYHFKPKKCTTHCTCCGKVKKKSSKCTTSKSKCSKNKSKRKHQVCKCPSSSSVVISDKVQIKDDSAKSPICIEKPCKPCSKRNEDCGLSNFIKSLKGLYPRCSYLKFFNSFKYCNESSSMAQELMHRDKRKCSGERSKHYDSKHDVTVIPNAPCCSHGKQRERSPFRHLSTLKCFCASMAKKKGKSKHRRRCSPAESVTGHGEDMESMASSWLPKYIRPIVIPYRQKRIYYVGHCEGDMKKKEEKLKKKFNKKRAKLQHNICKKMKKMEKKEKKERKKQKAKQKHFCVCCACGNVHKKKKCKKKKEDKQAKRIANGDDPDLFQKGIIDCTGRLARRDHSRDRGKDHCRDTPNDRRKECRYPTSSMDSVRFSENCCEPSNASPILAFLKSIVTKKNAKKCPSKSSKSSKTSFFKKISDVRHLRVCAKCNTPHKKKGEPCRCEPRLDNIEERLCTLERKKKCEEKCAEMNKDGARDNIKWERSESSRTCTDEETTEGSECEEIEEEDDSCISGSLSNGSCACRKAKQKRKCTPPRETMGGYNCPTYYCNCEPGTVSLTGTTDPTTTTETTSQTVGDLSTATHTTSTTTNTCTTTTTTVTVGNHSSMSMSSLSRKLSERFKGRLSSFQAFLSYIRQMANSQQPPLKVPGKHNFDSDEMFLRECLKSYSPPKLKSHPDPDPYARVKLTKKEKKESKQYRKHHKNPRNNEVKIVRNKSRGRCSYS